MTDGSVWEASAVVVDAIGRAFTEVAAATGEPTVLLARTAHGRGVKVVKAQPGKPRSPVPICARLAVP